MQTIHVETLHKSVDLLLRHFYKLFIERLIHLVRQPAAISPALQVISITFSLTYIQSLLSVQSRTPFIQSSSFSPLLPYLFFLIKLYLSMTILQLCVLSYLCTISPSLCDSSLFTAILLCKNFHFSLCVTAQAFEVSLQIPPYNQKCECCSHSLFSITHPLFPNFRLRNPVTSWV